MGRLILSTKNTLDMGWSITKKPYSNDYLVIDTKDDHTLTKIMENYCSSSLIVRPYLEGIAQILERVQREMGNDRYQNEIKNLRKLHDYLLDDYLHEGTEFVFYLRS